MTDLTLDAVATYTARYRETHTDEPLLHEPSMQAVVDMVLERAVEAVASRQFATGSKIYFPGASTPIDAQNWYGIATLLANEIRALKGPRP